MNSQPAIPDAETRARLIENLRRAREGLSSLKPVLELIELEAERDWAESPAGRFDTRRETIKRGTVWSPELQYEKDRHDWEIGREKLKQWWNLQKDEWERRRRELSELQCQTSLEEWQHQKQQQEHWWQNKQQERAFHEQHLQEWIGRRREEYRDLESPEPRQENELDL